MASNRVELSNEAPLMSRAQVLQAYGNRSVSWLYAEMVAGRVPRPIQLSSNAVAWVTEQIEANIAAKIAAGPVAPRKPRKKTQTAVAA